MPGGLLCEINLYEEVWLELDCIFQEIGENVNFFDILSTLKCSSVLQMPLFVCLTVSYVK